MSSIRSCVEIKFLPSGRPHAKKCNSHNVNYGTFNKIRECLIINETTETFFIYMIIALIKIRGQFY
jgi:hypothetical protein